MRYRILTLSLFFMSHLFVYASSAFIKKEVTLVAFDLDLTVFQEHHHSQIPEFLKKYINPEDRYKRDSLEMQNANTIALVTKYWEMYSTLPESVKAELCKMLEPNFISILIDLYRHREEFGIEVAFATFNYYPPIAILSLLAGLENAVRSSEVTLDEWDGAQEMLSSIFAISEFRVWCDKKSGFAEERKLTEGRFSYVGMPNPCSGNGGFSQEYGHPDDKNAYIDAISQRIFSTNKIVSRVVLIDDFKNSIYGIYWLPSLVDFRNKQPESKNWIQSFCFSDSEENILGIKVDEGNLRGRLKIVKECISDWWSTSNPVKIKFALTKK